MIGRNKQTVEPYRNGFRTGEREQIQSYRKPTIEEV